MGQPRWSVLHSQAGWHAASHVQAAVGAVLSGMQVCCSGGGSCAGAVQCLAWTKWQWQLRQEDLSKTCPPPPAAPPDCYCPMQLTDQQRDIIRAFTVDL